MEGIKIMKFIRDWFILRAIKWFMHDKRKYVILFQCRITENKFMWLPQLIISVNVVS